MSCQMQVLPPYQMSVTSGMPQKSHNQSACNDWLYLSGLASSYTCSICYVPNEVLHSGPAVWMNQSVIHASVKVKRVILRTGLLRSFDWRGRIYQNKVAVDLSIHSLLSCIPLFLYEAVQHQVGKSPGVITGEAGSALELCGQISLLFIL